MRTVEEYYYSIGSKLGYKYLLGGVRHFGYYQPSEPINHSKAQIQMMDLVASTLKSRRGAQILDVGCGEGKTAIYIAYKFGFRITGVDLLGESIEIANSKLKPREQLVKFQVGNFDELPFKDSTFDGLYAIESFIHSKNPIGTLKEFNRVLKPGGSIVIADYTTSPVHDIPERYQSALKWVAEGASAKSLLIINHDFYKNNLISAGFKVGKVQDITENIMPMLIWFRRMAFIPYQVVKLFNLQVKQANTTMGYFGKIFAENGWWKFVVVRATKK